MQQTKIILDGNSIPGSGNIFPDLPAPLYRAHRLETYDSYFSGNMKDSN